MPTARMFMAVPVTTCCCPRVTVTKAYSRAIRPPKAMASSRPTRRLPDRYVPTKPPQAPMRNMPSMAQIIMPVRSA